MTLDQLRIEFLNWFNFYQLKFKDLNKLNSVIRKLLSVSRITWVCEFPFSNYRELKHRSNISNENLMSKQRCAVNVNYVLDFRSLVWKKCKLFSTLNTSWKIIFWPLVG